MEEPVHSLKRHPLEELLSPEEWRQLCHDVQFGRRSGTTGYILLDNACALEEEEP